MHHGLARPEAAGAVSGDSSKSLGTRDVWDAYSPVGIKQHLCIEYWTLLSAKLVADTDCLAESTLPSGLGVLKMLLEPLHGGSGPS